MSIEKAFSNVTMADLKDLYVYSPVVFNEVHQMMNQIANPVPVWTEPVKKPSNKAAFKVGARVKFNDKVNPKYMVDVEATVLKLNPARAKIKLFDPIGRFSGIINAPYAILDIMK